MDRWEYFNPNPVKDKRTGDCAVRAICKATGFDWETVFAGLMVQACALSDMPSAIMSGELIFISMDTGAN